MANTARKRSVPDSGRGYEYWHAYIPKLRICLWCLDLYEDGEAIAGRRYLKREEARTHALLWVGGVVAA